MRMTATPSPCGARDASGLGRSRPVGQSGAVLAIREISNRPDKQWLGPQATPAPVRSALRSGADATLTRACMLQARKPVFQCGMNPFLSQANILLPLRTLRTRPAAQPACMVAPVWQLQTISCNCQSESSKKRLASP